jgi:uncharacterized protein with von Willebrand factor type A (vWA) domain
VTRTPHPVHAVALPLPMRGLFERLIERGAALGMRDYLDALRALESGHGGCKPARLRRLCEILWARTEEEHRTIAQWFDAITPLPDDALTCLNELLGPRPEPSPLDGPAAANFDGVDAVAGQNGSPNPRARVSFAPAASGEGLGLPRLEASPILAGSFVLRPRPLMPMRQLVLLWRRLRSSQRLGVKQELDLPASVRRRCELGVLQRPVLRACRRNTARLLVLADTSPSMAPWMPFLQVLEASLAHGQLGDVALRWFSNVPGSTLQGSALLEAVPPAPEMRQEVLRRFAGAAVLVVSDAGSARGGHSRRRVRRTQAFLESAARWGCRLVWINPMPAPRWSGTSAERIAAEGPVLMLPLDGPNLSRAVDILLGAR